MLAPSPIARCSVVTGRDEPGEQGGPDEANETPASFPAAQLSSQLSIPCLAAASSLLSLPPSPNPVSLRHWKFSIGPVLTHLLYRDAGSLRVTHDTLLACASTPTSSRSLDPWMPCFPCFPAHYQQSTYVFSAVVFVGCASQPRPIHWVQSTKVRRPRL